MYICYDIDLTDAVNRTMPTGEDADCDSTTGTLPATA